MNDTYHINIEGKDELKIQFEDETLNSGTINGKPFEWDCKEIHKGVYHIIKDHRSYNVELLEVDVVLKSFTIKINGNKYCLTAKDKYDELLHQLGFDNSIASKVNEIKAPMPGMVLEVAVKTGDEVKIGDKLLVLEAMKMENILRSPCNGTVKKIIAEKGKAVEKNQVLILFS